MGDDLDNPQMMFTSSLGKTSLDSPIRIEPLLLCSGKKKLPWAKTPTIIGKMKEEFKMISNHISLNQSPIMDISNISQMLKIKGYTPLVPDVMLNFRLEMEVGFRNVQVQLESFASGLLLFEDPQKESQIWTKLKETIGNPSKFIDNAPPDLLQYFSFYQILYHGILLTGNRDEYNPKLLRSGQSHGWKCHPHLADVFSISLGNYELFISKNFFISLDQKGQAVLGSRDHLLLLSDLCVQRFNLLFSGHMAKSIGKINYLHPTELSFMFEWGDEISFQFKNKAFDILSQWEALCTSVLLTHEIDQLCDSSEFVQTVKDDILSVAYTKEEKTWLESQFSKMMSNLYHLMSITPNKVSQSFGLFRIWGHPNIDPYLGIAKLKQIACQKKSFNIKKIKDISNLFMEKFSMSYREKNGRWPELDVSKLSSTNVIKRAVESNSALPIRSKLYHRNCWELTQFKQTFLITSKMNIADLVSDKSLSLGARKLMEHVRSQRNIGLATDRAVIVQWMMSDLQDPVQFLTRINDNGFPDDENVFGMCPKERELKTHARFFGLSTLSKRMYIVLTEALIAEYIVPYFPQITMMDDATSLSKKFVQKTRDMGDRVIRHSRSVVINIDFQKWNTYMRREETLRIFQEMDHLLGFNNCIARTHELFNSSWFYLADGTYLPTFIQDKAGKISMIEDEGSWTGHLGGVEGMRQKGWTVFTVCILLSVLEKTRIQFSLMGQGDNQVLILSFPSKFNNDQIKNLHCSVLKELDHTLCLIGPPLKKEETWSSSLLFAYGKVLIYKGLILSMSQKKMCRMFPLSNEGFPTIETAISSITSNSSSAVASDTDPIIPFSLNSFWCSHIFRNMFSKSYLNSYVPDKNEKFLEINRYVDKKRLTSKIKIPDNCKFSSREGLKNLLFALNIFPKCLGGYPIIYLSQHLIKSFPDPVTESIAILKKIHQVGTYEEKAMLINISKLDIHPEPNHSYLFSNVTGLNLTTPTTPGDVVKRKISTFIGKAHWITNNYVQTYIHISGQEQEELVEALWSMIPLNPIICHEILGATIVGRAKKAMDQFNKTGTMMKMATKDGTDLLKNVKNAESAYLKSVLISLSDFGNFQFNFDTCSRQTAQLLREVSWDNEHITAVTVPYPCEIFKLEVGFNCQNHSEAHKGYILLKSLRPLVGENWRNSYSLGESYPYLGSKTFEKVISSGKQVAAQSSPLLRNVAKLQQLVGWATEKDSNLAKCLNQLVYAVTDYPPSTLAPMSSAIAGSWEHRFSTDAVSRGGRVELCYNFLSHCSLSTDSLTAYCKGQKNVNLHFQASMSLLASLYSIFCTYDLHRSTECFHGHIACNCCISEINEDKVDVQEHDWTSLIASDPSSPFCWVKADNVILNSVRQSILFPSSENELITMMRSCKSAAKETMRKIRKISAEIGDGRSFDRTAWGISVAWVFKLDPLLYLVCLLIELFSYFLLRMYDHQLLLSTDNKVISDFHQYMTDFPYAIFGGLSPWFQNKKFLDFISIAPLFVSVPPSSMYSRAQCGKCIKSCLLRILTLFQTNDLTTDQLVDWNKYIFVGDEAFDSHPYMLHMCWNLLLGTNEVQESGVKMYRALKWSIEKYDPKESPTRIDILSLLKDNPNSVSNHLEIDEIGRFFAILDHAVIHHGIETTDFLCSAVVPYQYQDPALSMKIIEIDSLPIASSIVSIDSQTMNKNSGFYQLESKCLKNLPIPNLESHFFKLENLPTTAKYKLISILRHIKYNPSRYNKVGCFGDGAGGFTKIMLQLNLKGNVFYNSKMNSNDSFQNSIPNSYPPALAGFPEDRKRLITPSFTYEYSDDLESHNYSENYITMVKEKLQVIICDAEGDGWDNPIKGVTMLKSLLEIAEFSRTEIFIFKTYYSNPSMFFAQISMMQSMFSSSWIVRSYFSSQFSTEVYLIGKDATLLPTTKFILRDNSINIRSIISESCSITLIKLLLSLSTVLVDGQVGEQYSFKLKETDRLPLLLETVRSVSHRMYTALLRYETETQYLSKNYQFPSQYLIDIKKHTHIVKFNSSSRKNTKINLLKSFYVSKVCHGYIFMCLIGNIIKDGKDLSTFINKSQIIFYPTLNSRWNTIITREKPSFFPECLIIKLKDIILQDRIRFLIPISQELKKRQIIKFNHHGIDKTIFTMVPRLINHDSLPKFNWSFVPDQFPKSPELGIEIFGVPPQWYQENHLNKVSSLSEEWIKNRNKFVTNSKYWFNLSNNHQ